MSSGTTPLRDMIREAGGEGLRNKRAGRSYRKLAAKAIDPTPDPVTGVHVQASLVYITRLAHGEVKDIPSMAHLRALAAGFAAVGLEVQPEAVWVAAVIEFMPLEDKALRKLLSDHLDLLMRPAEEQGLEAIEAAELETRPQLKQHRRSA